MPWPWLLNALNAFGLGGLHDYWCLDTVAKCSDFQRTSKVSNVFNVSLREILLRGEASSYGFAQNEIY